MYLIVASPSARRIHPLSTDDYLFHVEKCVPFKASTSLGYRSQSPTRGNVRAAADLSSRIKRTTRAGGWQQYTSGHVNNDKIEFILLTG
ncbi:hypothetical protein IV203_004649 [Nitzschia inconspicua]|uniref:Uncharacterized protein n=1 Tax=Nitzschia inconspicua TaxID=303405 RepID=A0A9K3L5Z4_9STRA|nr:hypothetical protein IV203_004649 [Nitzschia inconspicua]